MKKRLTAIICTLALLLSGCSDFNSGSEALLAAPMLNDEQHLIYSALSNTGKNISIKYPKSGDNRSAFIIADIDGDDLQEAIAFYQDTSSSSEENYVRVNILDKINGEWYSVYDMKGQGTDIDKVAISSVNENTKYIFIGYITSSGATNEFCVYRYDDKKLTHIAEVPYSIMTTAQLDDDDSLEVLLISDKEVPSDSNTASLPKASAIVFDVDSEGELFVTSQVELATDVSRYVNIKPSIYSDTERCIYLDSLNENNTIYTEILYLNGHKLQNPVNTYKDELFRFSSRPQGYLTMDYDGDGAAEIPVTFAFLGYESNKAEETEYMTRWYQYENYDKLVRESYSFYNLNDAYIFILPGRWQGEVTVKKDPLTREIVFYKYEGSLENSTQELARIMVSVRTDTERYINDGYSLISSKGQLDYLIKLSDSDMSLTLDEAKNCFYIV